MSYSSIKDSKDSLSLASTRDDLDRDTNLTSAGADCITNTL